MLLILLWFACLMPGNGAGAGTVGGGGSFLARSFRPALFVCYIATWPVIWAKRMENGLMQNKTKMPVHCICDWLLANEQQRFSVRGGKNFTPYELCVAIQFKHATPSPLSPSSPRSPGKCLKVSIKSSSFVVFKLIFLACSVAAIV